MNLGVPELLAAGAVEAEQRLHFGILIRGREEHVVAHDGGRAVSAAGNQRFPQHVLVRGPFQRRFLIRGRDAVARESPPPRPVGCSDRDLAWLLLWLLREKLRSGGSGGNGSKEITTVHQQLQKAREYYPQISQIHADWKRK